MEEAIPISKLLVSTKLLMVLSATSILYVISEVGY